MTWEGCEGWSLGSVQAGFCTRQEGLREDSRQHWDTTTVNNSEKSVNRFISF